MGFWSTLLLIGAFIVLRNVAEHIGRRLFRGLSWWARIAFEFAVILPPLALIVWLLPKAGDGFSIFGMLAGAATGMLLSWAYAHVMKGDPQ